MALKLALNRTCAPGKTLPEFIALAQSVGIGAVEIRSDIEDREFADGTPASEVRTRLADAGLVAASVNALQRFNDWNADRAAEARRLVSYAAELGAPGLVLCPVHTPESWTKAEAAAKLRDGLHKLAPILRDHGVKGYVEPLGMIHSTMKHQEMAVMAVSDIDGWDCYQLCYDTFQFFRCGDTHLFPEHIGLTHISGINRADLTPAELTEPDRGLIFLGDRVGNIRQLQTLMSSGYQGFISIEPFDPKVQTDPDLMQHVRASLSYIRALVGADRAPLLKPE